MAKKRSYAAQTRYQERQTAKRGFVKVCIWIPEEARKRVLKMAEELRNLTPETHTEGQDNDQRENQH